MQHIKIEGEYIYFQRFYRPDIGPLPDFRYKLLGLWETEGVLIKAYFEVDRYPSQEGELLWHRYESSNIISTGRASYRYFLVDQYGGMILSNVGKARSKFKDRKILANYPLSEDNKPGGTQQNVIIVSSSLGMKEDIYIV